MGDKPKREGLIDVNAGRSKSGVDPRWGSKTKKGDIGGGGWYKIPGLLQIVLLGGGGRGGVFVWGGGGGGGFGGLGGWAGCLYCNTPDMG